MKKKINKFVPLPDKEYIVTDQCFWEQLPEEEQRNYNPYDEKRNPHYLNLVDPITGTMVNLPSGSVIKIVEVKK